MDWMANLAASDGNFDDSRFFKGSGFWFLAPKADLLLPPIVLKGCRHRCLTPFTRTNPISLGKPNLSEGKTRCCWT